MDRQLPTEATIEWMRANLAECTHKPGWKLSLAMDDDRPALVARYTAPDSRGVGHDVRLEGRRRLKATTDPTAFTDDVLAQLDDIERHETREWFRYKGQLVADPHAAPDRWHCPCGGVGPVRRASSWDCPGCGNTLIQMQMGDAEP